VAHVWRFNTTAIRDSLAQYVAVRRALGASFYEPELALGHFVDLLCHLSAYWRRAFSP
jgi:hypothetical protein